MKERIITAVVAILLFLPIVIFGGWIFKLLIYMIASIGLYELLKMRKTTKYFIPSTTVFLLLWFLLFPYDEWSWLENFYLEKSEITLLAVLLLLAYTVLVKNRFTFEDVGFLILSAIYVGMGFYYLMETREAGLIYIVYAFLVIWATDTGAYFFGRAIGKKKLWPKISPNKTVEGAIGGIVLACIVALILQLIVPVRDSTVLVLLVTILVSGFGQIGDLVESAFKRYYDVKDSGNLLPGHGGILDRFDSLIFIFPLLHFIQFIS
ncbi:phosphatidate cytidylyltransferase [Aquibacillus sp. 3ASR75-11]|uniref:Phosphatidate cytidylyltransferase n=1 Tax=Terrihalobacillus insolitus TaxID=2950438 RepID=A0A9X4AMJ4_9BACI|nr:phosphatidate cytidylyltransferase [Terrihalobacillus insolitus]MDC3414109.1 phosphatidate cytidylyltransferase [Terrihalobacillus insolitus]MDC3423550.1 phosphatidate cytidylyltransferase [Terrihalobacillus insolitus]